MKKRVCVCLTVLCLLMTLLPGCGGGSGLRIYPVVSAETAAPGDEITVQVFIKNCALFCATEFYLSYDAQYFALKDCKETEVTDLIAVVGPEVDEAGNEYLHYSGITTNTLDLKKDTQLLTATFIVLDKALAGEPFFGIAMDYLQVGEDASGDTVVDKTGDVNEGREAITVTAGTVAEQPTDAATDIPAVSDASAPVPQAVSTTGTEIGSTTED